jgi:nucleoside-diphosphate-sugar epimerase
MRIFVAGAAGALGKQLIPRLVEDGHEVTGMTRSESKSPMVQELGATPVVADGLNPEQVANAVAESNPEVIVHELTALSGDPDMRHWDRYFELTNRLRTEATDHLLAAGRAVGVKRFVAQSYAGWPYARNGTTAKSEEDRLDPDPVPAMRESMDAIRYLEDTVIGAEWTEGIVLRYGGFYGPGTSLWPEGEIDELLQKRRFPVVGDGKGVWSFVRIDDAAAATVAAIVSGKRGIYNVVDDSPEPVSEWLPGIADALGAKPPRHVPRWLGRLLAGEVVAVMMTEIRGASNEKAKRELGWRPEFPSWREGLAEVSK